LQYLEEKYPQNPLLPQDIIKKSINCQVASIVSSSIQPLQNTTLVHYIGEIVSPDEKLPWAQYHIRKGLVALEKLLVNHAGKYATGDEIYLADLYLAPQLDNAINRYKLDMTEFPLLLKLNMVYCQTPAFQQIFGESLQQIGLIHTH
ncbi:glutathione S-transferase zeta class-like, partial [Bidens hawaiensis]|uniref:glutathione S-transferase zeta class-like n=1 Tax=Bidens hawaiensis TaxID=980011 RepID=UPI0040496B3A